MVGILKEAGITRALISAGTSTIYALGAPPDDPDGWPVSIRHPKDESKPAFEARLRNESMSTSGNYEKFFWADGKMYSHIMDPRTGYPAEGVLAVSVIAPKALDSEAWTKPFYIRGREWAARQKPNGFRVYLCEDHGVRSETSCALLP
jgi:thiamine biosynthesis lipoprotein